MDSYVLRITYDISISTSRHRYGLKTREAKWHQPSATTAHVLIDALYVYPTCSVRMYAEGFLVTACLLPKVLSSVLLC